LAHPVIRDRANATNALICTETGEHRLHIDPNAVSSFKDLEQVAWKEDANGRQSVELDKRDPERTNVSDALGYLIQEDFGNATLFGLARASLKSFSMVATGRCSRFRSASSIAIRPRVKRHDTPA
jgi:hypothetical protein